MLQFSKCNTIYAIWSSFSEDHLITIPDSFGCVRSYVGAMEPLLFEECKSQVKKSWEETDKPHFEVKVLAVEKTGRGEKFSVFALP